MSEEKTYSKYDPRSLGARKAGLVMGMGFGGLLLVFGIMALQELK